MDPLARDTTVRSESLTILPEQQTSTRRWARIGIGAAGLSAFLLLASVFDPGLTTASDNHVPGIVEITPRRAAEALDGLLRRPHPKGWRNVGVLEGTEYCVLVYASPDGARYTVCNRLGETLERDLAAEDVYRSFPELDIPGMRLDPDAKGELTTPMMLVEPSN